MGSGAFDLVWPSTKLIYKIILYIYCLICTIEKKNSLNNKYYITKNINNKEKISIEILINLFKFNRNLEINLETTLGSDNINN